MIPIFPFDQVLRLFNIFIFLNARIRQHKRIGGVNESERDIIILLSVNLNMLYEFLKLLEIIYPRLMLVKLKSSKRKLVKPHILLHLMHGYRATLNSTDVWAKLQENWTHFFWLTGETPDTLNILVERICIKFMTFKSYGPNGILDLKNQVGYLIYLF